MFGRLAFWDSLMFGRVLEILMLVLVLVLVQAKEAAEVIDIMKQRCVTGVRNQCRFYSCQPGDTSSQCVEAKAKTGGIVDRGNDKPGCHWYMESNVTTPWAAQTGLPGADSEFAWDTTGQEEAYIWGVCVARHR